MTADQLGAELLEHYGERLPNPEQEPIRFHYFVKMYLYDSYVRQFNQVKETK